MHMAVDVKGSRSIPLDVLAWQGVEGLLRLNGEGGGSFFQPDPDADHALGVIEAGAAVVLVSGRAGTGKSRLIKRLQEGAHGARTLVVAPTGVAALNLGVPTIHAAFSLPIGCLDREALPCLNKPVQVLRGITRLVIDEISMVRADVLDGIDARLREARGSSMPFGGVQIVMVGDFLQLPPVVGKGEWGALHRLGYKMPFAFCAHALRGVQVVACSLKTVWRQSDPSFKAVLADIRAGVRTEHAIGWLNAQCARPHRGKHTPLVLATTRSAAAQHNLLGLTDVFASSAPVRFCAQRSGAFHTAGALPAPEHLDVAPGARVVALRNDPGGLFANGSLGTVVDTRMTGDVVHSAVQVLFDGQSRPVWVEKTTWERARAAWCGRREGVAAESVGSYTQIPLAPGYALTVHKSQGLSLDDVRLDVGRGAFSPGQLYVALSRARSVEGLSFVRPLSVADAQVDSMLVSFLEWAESRSLA